MGKKDILYLLTITTDTKGIEILENALKRAINRIKYNVIQTKEKRKTNKLYARSKKEIEQHNKAMLKKGGR